MILLAFIGIFVAPLYVLTTDPAWIIGGFILQGAFAGANYGGHLRGRGSVHRRPAAWPGDQGHGDFGRP
jgi:hypothetical protein